MPYVTIAVDNRTMQVLERESVMRGVPLEQLAAQAVESAAIAMLPGGYPSHGFDGMHFRDSLVNTHPPRRHELDLGGTRIGMYEQQDGSYQFGGR